MKNAATTQTMNTKSSIPSTASRKLSWVILSFTLAGVIFAIYAKSLNNSFIDWDDNRYIYENLQIKSLSLETLKDIFDPRTYRSPELYIPLTLLSYQIEYFFFKLNPLYYHLTNLIFHILNTLLIFWLIYLWNGKRGLAFCSALLFALHPTHVESVAWATERRDVLSTFFFLASLVCYSKFLVHRTVLTYGLCLSIFLLALFSKPMAVTLPAVLLLIDYKTRRPFDKTSIMEKVPFGILSLVFSFIAISLQEGSLDTAYPVWERSLLMIRTIVFYLGKLIMPVRLSTMYSDPSFTDLSWKFGVATVIFLVVLALVCLSCRRTREAVFGYLFFLVTLFPTLPATASPLYFFAADRYLYLPSVGPLYLFALGSSKIYCSPGPLVHFKKATILAMIGFLTLFFSGASYKRSLVWKDSESVALDALRHYPNAVSAHAMLGTFYTEHRMTDKAIAAYQKALEIAPDHPQAYHMLGVLLTLLGREDEAQTYFKKALEHNPGSKQTHYNMAVLYKQKGQFQEALLELQKASFFSPDDPLLYLEQGAIYKALGERDKAMESFQTAIRLKPDSMQAHNELGVLYADGGRSQEAIVEYQRAIELNPLFAAAHSNLGLVYLRLGRADEALEKFVKALKLDSANAEIHNNLGAAYGTKGQLELAAAEFKKAIELKANYTGAYENLGVIYAEEGRPEEARKMFQKVLEIDPHRASAQNKLKELESR